MSNLQIADRYEVQETLGAGTGGIVYAGVDLATGEKVAIKHFQKGSAPALHEASAIIGLNHPNIVRALDFSYLGAGDLYIVYEFVNGGSLRDVLEERPVLPAAEALSIVMEVFRGLDYLHGLGLIHCDIKPDNIFRHTGDDGTPVHKIGDLGVAHSLAQVQEDHRIAGTPAYTAPERFIESFTFNSDLYSAGIMFYEMVVGERPFDGDPKQIAFAHRRNPVDYSKVSDSRLKDFLSGLLDKDPRHRIQKASEAIVMVDALVYGSSRTRFVPRKKEYRTRPPIPPPAGMGNLLRESTFSLDGKFEKMFALHCDGRPLLAVEYASYLEVLDGLSGEPLNLVIPNIGLSVLVANPSTLVYATKSRICQMSLETQKETTLAEDCARVIGVFLSSDRHHLIWADASEAHYIDLRGGGDAVDFPCSNFGFTAFLRVVGEDAVLFTTGPINPTLHVAGIDGEVRKEFPLEAPVMDMTSGRDEFLAVTFSEAGEDRVLYRLSADLQISKEVIEEAIDSFAFTRDAGFLLAESGDLLTFPARSGKVIRIPAFIREKGNRSVFATYDNRFVFTATERNKQTHISCFENNERQ